MFTVGFEPTISAGERPQTNALDHAATGTDMRDIIISIILKIECHFFCYSALHGPQKWYGVVHKKMMRIVKYGDKLLWL